MWFDEAGKERDIKASNDKKASSRSGTGRLGTACLLESRMSAPLHEEPQRHGVFGYLIDPHSQLLRGPEMLLRRIAAEIARAASSQADIE